MTSTKAQVFATIQSLKNIVQKNYEVANKTEINFSDTK